MGRDVIPFDGGHMPTTRDQERQMVQCAVEASLPLVVGGHTFTNRWLDEALGLGAKPRDTASFEKWQLRRCSLVERWKAELLVSHAVHVENHHGHGYVVIPPEQTANVAVQRVRYDVHKAIQQAASKIVNASMDGLTPRQRQDRHDALAYVNKVDMALTYARPKPPRPGSRVAHPQ